MTYSNEPTEPGFYKYSGGRDVMIFLLDATGQWWVISDSGIIDQCVWAYVEQALGVWTLERVT